jgi:selenocysteine-specific elongation factor
MNGGRTVENGKKCVTVGVAGHVDHGKTSLVRCLTGVDTDRMKEEKRRGVSIEPGIAPWINEQGLSVSLVDVPGHTDFLGNTVKGLCAVDLAMLVVAADDGVMPQTVEHLAVLSFFGAKSGFVVLNKTDLVDDETLELAEMEIRDAVKGSFLEGKSVIRFSALEGTGLERILEEARREAGLIDGRPGEGPFRLWIDRTTRVNGFGTVVSGTVLSGVLQTDDMVRILPAGMKARVRFIESHGQRIGFASAGQRIGINLHRTAMEDVGRGMVLTREESAEPIRMINAEVAVVTGSDEPLRSGMRVKVFIGTSVTSALSVVFGTSVIKPCERGLVQFRFDTLVPAKPGDGFVVSLMNRNRIIGGGTILETTFEKCTRGREAKITPRLTALTGNDADAYIRCMMDQRSPRPFTVDELAARSGFSPEHIDKVRARGIENGHYMRIGRDGFYSRRQFEERVTETLGAAERSLYQGTLKLSVNANEIRDGIGMLLNDALLHAAIDELCRTGRLIRKDSGYVLPGFQVILSGDERTMARNLLDFAERCGFDGFTVNRFCEETGDFRNEEKIRKMACFLHHQDRLIRLQNNRFISCGALDRIKENVKRHISDKGCFALSDSLAILGYTRTMAIIVLEHLDDIGFTRRVGDVRVLPVEEETAE